MLQLDTTTQGLLEAAATPTARAQAVLGSISGAITVTVYDASGTAMGSGTMSSLGTLSANLIVLGTTADFEVTSSGTPDPSTWTIEFKNSSNKWLKGSFGLSSSTAEFKWSLSAWTAGMLGTISNAYATVQKNEVVTDVTDAFNVAQATINSAPQWTSGTPTTLSLTPNSQYNFAPHANDPDGDALTFTKVSGIGTLSSSGVYTAPSSITTGNVVIRVSDGSLTASTTCTVTVITVSSATFVIPVSSASRTFNGNTLANWTSLPTNPGRVPTAGDIIELAAGTHGKLEFQNLTGSLSSRITIRNGNGLVTVSGTSSFIFTMRNCSYVTVDGSNAGQTYGVKVTSPSADDGSGGITYLKNRGNNRYLTFKNFEVDGKWGTMSKMTTLPGTPIGVGSHDVSVMAAAQPGVFQQEFLVYENFRIRNVPGEGMYVGGRFVMGTAPMKDIVIRNGTIENTGREAINNKMCYEGTNAIHGLTIRNVCNSDNRGHGAIGSYSSKMDIYDNIIDEGQQGIQLYSQEGPLTGVASDGFGPYTSFVSRIYNNLITNGTDHGIAMVGVAVANSVPPKPYIYNNTVANNDGVGIRLGSATSPGWVRNNIVFGNTGGTIDVGSGGSTQANNKTTTTFLNTTTYHLTAENSDTNAVGTPGTDISLTDLEGISRSGTASKGAYEYTP